MEQSAENEMLQNIDASSDVRSNEAADLSGVSAMADASDTAEASNAMPKRPALEARPKAASLPPGDVQTHPLLDESSLILQVTERINQEARVRNHYYVKIAVTTLLCALLLLVGVPVFMESRVTGSISYTALGVVLVGFGLILAVAVVVLLFRPPWNK